MIPEQEAAEQPDALADPPEVLTDTPRGHAKQKWIATVLGVVALILVVIALIWWSSL